MSDSPALRPIETSRAGCHPSEDGELYTLLKSRNYQTGLLCVQLWRGIPGSCVRRFPLSPRWLDTYVSVFLSPDGAFVIADCADYETVRMWHTLTGEPHACFNSGPDFRNTGTICSMQSMCRMALVVYSGTIELWNYHDGTRSHRWEHFDSFFPTQLGFRFQGHGLHIGAMIGN